VLTQNKMAAAAIFENRKNALTQPFLNRFWWNLIVVWPGKGSVSPSKIFAFYNFAHTTLLTKTISFYYI
jgi:hypothetical protein